MHRSACPPNALCVLVRFFRQHAKVPVCFQRDGGGAGSDEIEQVRYGDNAHQDLTAGSCPFVREDVDVKHQDREFCEVERDDVK